MLSGFVQGHAVGYPGGLTTIRTRRAFQLLGGRVGVFIDGVASHTSDELREHRAAMHVERDVDRGLKLVLCSDGSLGRPRLLDVPLDLRDELGLAREGTLVP